PSPPPAFELEEDASRVRLKAPGITAEVALADGSVSFLDAAGRPLLAERPGGREVQPAKFDGRDYYSLRQRFVSSEDEALYGTALHQQGWMKHKGRGVALLQHNTDNTIPYLVSTRTYGILWDNNSSTRYGDPRGLRALQESLQVYDASGRPG